MKEKLADQLKKEMQFQLDQQELKDQARKSVYKQRAKKGVFKLFK